MKSNNNELSLQQLAEQQQDTAKELQRLVEKALDLASKAGADQAEVWSYNSVGNNLEVRNQQLETLEFNQDSQLTLNLYFDKAKGSVSINDLTDAGVIKGVQAAVDIGRFTQADPYAGLADAERMFDLKQTINDLKLNHPSDKTIPYWLEQAKQTEAAGLAVAGIKQSEGANFYGHSSVALYANSHGFFGKKNSSRYSLSASMIAETDAGMVRDGHYSVSRDPVELISPVTLGQIAAEKVTAKLVQGKAKAGKFPVIFSPEMARSIWGHLLSALKGGALYQKSSFMLDKKGHSILPSFVTIKEDPFLIKAFGSSYYDSEGVACYQRDLVTDGVLKDYFLSSYSARRLGLESTASAGGIHNIVIGHQDLSQTQLMQQLGTGLLVTELMGQGVNIVTGNYSRGASGFWFENGQIKHFVQEITIAGNLPDMLQNIVALCDDLDHRSSIITGSMAIDGMTIASD